MNKQASNACLRAHSERGFSVVKLLFWLAVAGFIVINGAAVFTAYYANSQVQGCFDSLSEKMATASESDAHAKLKQLFKLQYLDEDDLPEGFYDELQINAAGDSLEVSSWYIVTIWPLGRVEDVDELGEYAPDELSGMDILRDKTRIDLEFEPYAISGTGSR